MDTDVHRVRLLDDEQAVAGWITLIGTRFPRSGSHSFHFKDGKISRLRIVMSPKADVAEQFDLDALSVHDIGRLSLAAWMVL